MVATAISAPSSVALRVQSVDAMRGAIMMLMAIDHIRDYVARSAMQFLPTDLTRTTAAIFFTRWITHFCAPVFMLTAGLGAFFWMNRGHRSKSELSRFLVTRGIWLILLELTLMRMIMFFQISFRGNLVLLIILWAIGISMIALAALAVMGWLDRFHFPFANPLIVFGRVPFFYYVAHMLLAHLIAVGMSFARYGRHAFLLIPPPSMGSPSKLFPPDYGFPLWTVYAIWIAVVLLLYPACRWFASVKQSHHEWWLSYL
jgi:uncharacterized membrane protein